MLCRLRVGQPYLGAAGQPGGRAGAVVVPARLRDAAQRLQARGRLLPTATRVPAVARLPEGACRARRPPGWRL